MISIGPDKQNLGGGVKLIIFSYASVHALILGAQKNGLIETVLLSIYNICFG